MKELKKLNVGIAAINSFIFFILSFFHFYYEDTCKRLKREIAEGSTEAE